MGMRNNRIRTSGCPSGGKRKSDSKHHKGHRQIQMERETFRMNRQFDVAAFCRARIYPSAEEGFKYLVIAGGDVRRRMNLQHTKFLEQNVLFVDIDGVPHTVMRMSDKAVWYLTKAKTLKGFYNSFRSILAESDIRQFFYELWVAGTNILAQLQRQTEFYRQREAERKGTAKKPDPVSGQVRGIVHSVSTVERAAKVYGIL